MWHPYIELPSNPTGLKRPFIEIELVFPSSVRQKTFALVDSGADFCQFDAELAKLAGVDITKFPCHTHLGAGGLFKCYEMPVSIKFHKKIMVMKNAAWSSMRDPKTKKTFGINLLGREDFFKYFDSVRFDSKNSRFEIK